MFMGPVIDPRIKPLVAETPMLQTKPTDKATEHMSSTE